ncbi:MAG: hypothetical protein CMH53_03990 [Myxococcales bacterium]|nr:hypothetical protein [Myxococcales bacterium]
MNSTLFSKQPCAWLVGAISEKTVAFCTLLVQQGIELVVSDAHASPLKSANVPCTVLEQVLQAAERLNSNAQSELSLWIALTDAIGQGSKLRWVICTLPDRATADPFELASVNITRTFVQGQGHPTVVLDVNDELLQIGQQESRRQAAHANLKHIAAQHMGAWDVERQALRGIVADGAGLVLTQWPMGEDQQFDRYFDGTQWLASVQDVTLLSGPPPKAMDLIGLDTAFHAACWSGSSKVVTIATAGRLCALALSDLTHSIACHRALTFAADGAQDAVMVCSSGIDITTARALTGHTNWPKLRVIAAPSISDEALELLVDDERLLILSLPQPWTSKVHRELIATAFGVFHRPRRAMESSYLIGAPLGSQALSESAAIMMQTALHASSYVQSRAMVIADAEGTLAICGGQSLSTDAVQIGIARARRFQRPCVAVVDGALHHVALIAQLVACKIEAIAVQSPELIAEEVVQAADAAGLCIVAAPDDWRTVLTR